MKTITIRGIDNELDSLLKISAKEKSMSVNQFLLGTLRKMMGLEKDNIHTKVYHDLDFLFGNWTEKEFSEFQHTQQDFSRIDEEMWK
ncbi:MAG: antitoxin [Candidatus Marinimicrobia bacterium]|nr:antitoxin [Candidatus Neomarinimicrobiota bacterium]